MYQRNRGSYFRRYYCEVRSRIDHILLNRTLWLGCLGRITIVNLQTMTTIKDQKIVGARDDPQTCMQFLSYNNTVFAGLISGDLHHFAVDGSDIATYPNIVPQLTTLEGRPPSNRSILQVSWVETDQWWS